MGGRGLGPSGPGPRVGHPPRRLAAGGRPASVARYCHHVGAESVEQGSFSLVSGESGGPLRSAHASFIGWHHLLLAAGGLSDDRARLGAFDDLVSVANDLAAETQYAGLDLEDAGQPAPSYPRRRNAAPLELINDLLDEVILDAYPYQVLGSGHLARLERAGSPRPLPSVPLAGGRFGVQVGDPQDWLRAGDRMGDEAEPSSRRAS